jgi:hypothetical protein
MFTVNEIARITIYETAAKGVRSDMKYMCCQGISG